MSRQNDFPSEAYDIYWYYGILENLHLYPYQPIVCVKFSIVNKAYVMVFTMVFIFKILVHLIIESLFVYLAQICIINKV